MTDNQEEPVICDDDEQQKASDALAEIIDILNKYNLRTQELTLVYGNLGYVLGASIDEIDIEVGGPTLDELKQNYYTDPKLGVALMLQGMLVTSWHAQVAKGNMPEIRPLDSA